MARRTHEGPMDFEYQNGTGPVDSRSPFMNVGAKQKSFMNVSPERSPFKRPGSAYDYPARPSHAQPSSPGKARQTPAYNALFTTPRKPVATIDDSSAGETPKSPERDDSDATPDTNALNNAVHKFNWEQLPQLPAIVNTMEPKSPGRRDSLLVRIKKQFYNNSGRGEIPRGDMIHVKENRVRKIKSRDVRRRRRHSISSSASDDDVRRSPRKSPRKASIEQQPSMIDQSFSFIGRHADVPRILSLYAQLSFNVFLLSACAYWIYTCWITIQQDVDKAAWDQIADIMAEIETCAHHYRINGCASSTRVPALDQVCKEWDLCMNRDATKIARSRVTAHTFAQIFNSFIDPISWKSIIVTMTLVFGCFAISNFAFVQLRTKAEQLPHYPAYPPPTPQRTFSGENAGYAQSPWHPQQSLEPGADYGQIEGRGSPVRRLAYS